MNDEEISVHGDQDDGECGEEDTGGLGGSDQFTQVLHLLSQGPILNVLNENRENGLSLLYLGQEVHKSERHCEGTEEDVGDGEVGNEDVPGGQHDLVGQERDDNGKVANEAEDDDNTVEDNQAVVDCGLQPLNTTNAMINDTF